MNKSLLKRHFKHVTTTTARLALSADLAELHAQRLMFYLYLLLFLISENSSVQQHAD